MLLAIFLFLSWRDKALHHFYRKCLKKVGITHERLEYKESIDRRWRCVDVCRSRVVFPCGRLSWLPVSFLLHVKYTLSYRIVCCRLNPACLPPVSQGPASVSCTTQGYPAGDKTCPPTCPPQRCTYQRHRPVIGNKALLSQSTYMLYFRFVSLICSRALR